MWLREVRLSVPSPVSAGPASSFAGTAQGGCCDELMNIHHAITHLKPAKLRVTAMETAIANTKEKSIKLEKRLATATSECEEAVKQLKSAQNDIAATAQTKVPSPVVIPFLLSYRKKIVHASHR